MAEANMGHLKAVGRKVTAFYFSVYLVRHF